MTVNLSIGFISYFTSTILFISILILEFIGRRQGQKGRQILLLIASTLIWSALLTLSQVGSSRAIEMVFVAELLRYYTWFYVLHHLLGVSLRNTPSHGLMLLISPIAVSVLFAISLVSLYFNNDLIQWLGLGNPNSLHISWMMLFSLIGLVLVEQLYRNTEEDSRWKISYFCISAGAIFIYDFFVYSNALLIQQINYEYWSARGLINVLIIPTLLISAARNPSLSSNIHISRQFVFHSTTLLGSGLYLLIMSITGYYIKVKSGEWGNVLQAAFLFAALLLFTALFLSSSLKKKIKLYINRSFNNKYDYREEWRQFSNILLTNDPKCSIYHKSMQSVCRILDVKGAQLWRHNDQKLQYKAHWKIPPKSDSSISMNSVFGQFIQNHQEIFTQQEYAQEARTDKSEKFWFLTEPDSWIILPLWVNDSLFGFIHMNRGKQSDKLDQEDRELLTTITHHVALYLSQHEISQELQHAEKFKGINQMTAFLTHDLNTLLNQLFLLVENAKIHKNNPAFINDMISTLDHVTDKMQRLVNQLKNPEEKSADTTLDISDILNEIVEDYTHLPVIPQIVYSLKESNLRISANANELTSAIKHIVQNAVDSVDKNTGKVTIELDIRDHQKLTITIIDNGKGMTQEFIANRLFKPFDSTKGVAGMGIGVYQSREYIRSLDGEIEVKSQPAQGTTFTITLPINKNDK